jgi:glycosyltransferase involved in cell wall biosynthesis
VIFSGACSKGKKASSRPWRRREKAGSQLVMSGQQGQMRIGLDGFPLASPKTGVGHYTFELARAISNLSPDDRFELISPLGFGDGIAAEVDATPNLSLVSVPTNMITRRWWGIGLPRYVRRAGLDIFHGTNYEIPLWNRERTIVTVHDLSIFVHPDKHEIHIGKRARRRLPIMLRSAALIITPTEAVKREVAERFKIDPGRIAVTPEAPRSDFRPMPPTAAAEAVKQLGIDEDFILFVGTIEPRKNLVTLVRAFDQILRHTSHRPQLVIAGGEGWLMDELHQLIGQTDFGDRIRFTGYVEDHDLRALYSSCKVLVYPSLYEGFGLPPLEAMACGAAVIAGNIPALQETLGGNACLIDPLDSDALAKAIVGFLVDENQRQHFSSLGQSHAAQFTWERTARLTMEVYQRLLVGSRQR